MASRLERLNDEQLLKYARYAEGIVGTINNTSISDFANEIINTDYERKLANPLGGKLTRYDLEYIFYILNYNDLDQGIQDRPQLSDVSVDFVTDERVYVEYTRTGEVESYLDRDLDSGYMYYLQDIGELDPYDWDITGKDEKDWDTRDSWFNV